jgi:hypothetical protein
MDLRSKIGMRVAFSNDILHIPILNEREWFEDYKNARIGHWIIDAFRFKQRVLNIERDIAWIFDDTHRKKHFR